MLEPFGWSARVSELAVSTNSPTASVARVTRIDRGIYTIMTCDGSIAASLSGELKELRNPVDRPTIGDWVTFSQEGVVQTVLPRWSVFVRGDSDKLQAQAVAANVDTVFVVHALDVAVNLRRLERELVLAFQSGARPVVVLSKADQCSDIDRELARTKTCAPGCDVIVTSAETSEGIDALLEVGRDGATLAFIGASGVGKSTLINALLGSEVQLTGAIREFDGKGRHTTSARSLFALRDGAVLIDTPGLRSVGMWRSDEGLALAFSDIEDLAVGCRFSNCTHDHEPSCAVQAAVAVGLIDVDRVANLQLLQRELDDLDDEAEARQRVVKQQQRSPSRVARSAPKGL